MRFLFSTIFRTFNSNIDNSISKIGAFNKSFWAMKQDLANGHGIGYSVFGGQGYDKGDAQKILDLNTALNSGVKPAKAWATTMGDASIAAQNATRNCLRTKGSLKDLANGMQTTTVASKAATLGLKALSVAANMALSIGISLIINGIISAFQKAKQAEEDAIEATKKHFEELKSDVSELNDLIQEYKDLQINGEWDNTDIETKKQLQEDINKLLDDEADKIDIVNGKYDDTLKKLFKERNSKLDNLERSAYDAKRAKGKELWDEVEDIDIRAYSASKTDDEWNSSGVGIKYFEKYDSLFDRTEINEGYRQYILQFDDFNDALNKYDQMVQLLDEMYANGDQDTQLYNDVNKMVELLKDKVEAYRESNDEYKNYKIEKALSDYIIKNEGGYVDNQAEYNEVLAWIEKKFKGKKNKKKRENAINFLESWFPEFVPKSSTFSVVGDVTAALSDLEEVSDNIGKLSSAYKELNDDGYITIGTINELQEATGLSGDEWAVYETKLLNAKKGSAEFNQVMSDLTYEIIKNKVQIGDLTNATDEEVAAIENKIAATLRENGVTNASAVAHDAVIRAQTEDYLISQKVATAKKVSASALMEEASAAGLDEAAYRSLLAQEILFDNNKLNTQDKCEQILEIANAAGVATTQMSLLNSEISAIASKELGSGSRTEYFNSLGGTTINAKDRTDGIRNKGNLYKCSDGKTFEDFNEAVYYQTALNNANLLTSAYNNTLTLPHYSSSSSSSSSDNDDACRKSQIFSTDLCRQTTFIRSPKRQNRIICL